MAGGVIYNVYHVSQAGLEYLKEPKELVLPTIYSATQIQQDNGK